MKHLLFSTLILGCMFSCVNDQSELLKAEILDLQSEIRAISNELEVYDFQGLNYQDDQVISKINEFKEKRNLQASKVRTLDLEFDEIVDFETITCGDFESTACLVENWDISTSNNVTVEITQDCSYNETSSLRLSAPFIENEFNIPGLEIEGFVNGIEAATVYKVRFWMKYSGTSDLSNGPMIHIYVLQDGEWLDEFYEGFHETNENRVVDEDWKLYSFQIATITASPLELDLWTNLENVCIDDIHIVKKDE